jgi:hypothetical protein
MIAFAAGGSAYRSSPLITTWPASGRSRPVIIDREVVFPGPVRPYQAGEGTRRDVHVDPGHRLLVTETLAQPANRDGWLSHGHLP